MNFRERWWGRKAEEKQRDSVPEAPRVLPQDDDAVLRRGEEAERLLRPEGLLTHTLHLLRSECFARLLEARDPEAILEAHADLIATGRVSARIRSDVEKARGVRRRDEERKQSERYRQTLTGRPAL